jgi:nicotinate-nucleotide pyrophosphorylase (carboxylating)
MDFFRTHNAADELHCTKGRYANFCFDLLELLYRSDVKNNDITSSYLISENQIGTGKILAHQAGVVAGLEEVQYFLKKEISLKSIRFVPLVKDGVQVKKGSALATLEGPVGDLLKAERGILNTLQRMSGIATQAAAFVKKVPKNVLVVPTRKTLWGLLDKKACALGGAGTHRLDLQDAILVKDNHLVAIDKNFPQLFNCLTKISAAKLKQLRFIEVEVTSIADFKRLLDDYHKAVIKPNALYVMLDNFSVSNVKTAVKYLQKTPLAQSVFLEASGGVTYKNIGQYGKTGVQIISSGALTHSVMSFDCSFELSYKKRN